MRECPRCGGDVEGLFRYCPWCAEPQRVKLVEFFGSHPRLARDRGKALRVSRYLAPLIDERHVRFSVWRGDDAGATAEAAVSLDDVEARRLADFLYASEPRGRRARQQAPVLKQLRNYVRALR
jgi:hypothetical protein